MRVFSFPCFRHFMTRHFGVLSHSPSLSADLPSQYVRWRKEITNVVVPIYLSSSDVEGRNEQ